MPEDSGAFTLSVQSNGINGATTERVGFSLQSGSDPIRAEPFVVPLSLSDTVGGSITLGSVAATRQYAAQLELTTFDQVESSRWQSEHALSGNTAAYSRFGLWSTVQPAMSGYFSGSPTWWGAYVYGTPTSSAELQFLGAKRWDGLAGSQWLFPDALSLSSHYGAVSVAFDPVTKTASITFQLTQTHSLGYSLSYPRGYVEFDDAFVPGASVADATFQCDAPVDVMSGEFSCTLPGVAGGTIRGRFYGPNGNEVAGVFTRWDWSGPSLNWGLIGGFVARSPSPDAQATSTKQGSR